METKLTQEQKVKLLKAIDLARGYGQCAYVIDGEPGCVIGQLAALEGVAIERLKQWDSAAQYGGSKAVISLLCDGECAELEAYGDVLCAVQRHWDAQGYFHTLDAESAARAAMRAEVANA